jgi:diguanylate cyclase (GGDEF)-like protein/PAS domain S-box-containing protein
MALESNLGTGDRDVVLDTMFAQHPDALVVAIADSGIFMPMPPGVPLTGQQVITGARAAVDLVVSEDQVTVIEAWSRLRVAGAANALVRPLADPEQTVRLHFVDARHRYGTILGFITDFSGALQAGQRIGDVEVVPRVGVVRKDPVAVIIEVDAATPRMLGWPVEELVGRRTLDLLHPDDHQRAIESWMDMLAAPGATRRVRLRHRHRDGHYLWLEITNHNLLNDPGHNCVIAEMLNISDEMAAHEALQANELLLRRLTETLPLGVLQLDPQFRVIYQNEQAAEMFGTELDQVVGPWGTDPVPATERPAVNAALRDAFKAGVDADLESGYHHPTGGMRRYSMNIRPLLSPTDEVSGVVVCVADVTEAARLREELKHHATFDSLTGCLNRASILAEMDRHLAGSTGVAAVFIDLNQFKEINDSLGHAAGDDLLRYVAASLRTAVRGTDLLGRIGGDEFLIVAREVSGRAEAQRIGESLAAHLATCAIELDGRRVQVRASIGVAFAQAGETRADALIARADAAMYQAKRLRTGPLGLVVCPAQSAA